MPALAAHARTRSGVGTCWQSWCANARNACQTPCVSSCRAFLGTFRRFLRKCVGYIRNVAFFNDMIASRVDAVSRPHGSDLPLHFSSSSNDENPFENNGEAIHRASNDPSPNPRESPGESPGESPRISGTVPAIWRKIGEKGSEDVSTYPTTGLAARVLVAALLFSTEAGLQPRTAVATVAYAEAIASAKRLSDEFKNSAARDRKAVSARSTGAPPISHLEMFTRELTHDFSFTFARLPPPYSLPLWSNAHIRTRRHLRRYSRAKSPNGLRVNA